MKRLTLGLLVAVAGAACSDGVTGPDELSGVYAYQGTDSTGTLLLIGTLQLAFSPDSSVTGSWAIDWAPDADTDTEVGPQVGEGTLQGRWGADGLFLDLNPGVADNNVFLAGTLVRDIPAPQLAGDWSHSTLVGAVAAGLFTATGLPSGME
jgi:hypothetical protein